MKVYIAGPMTGIEEWNHPAFKAAENRLDGLGILSFNPAHLFNGDTTRPRRDYLRAGLQELLRCDGIYLLDGWRNSQGALLEARIAAELGLVFFVEAPNSLGFF